MSSTTTNNTTTGKKKHGYLEGENPKKGDSDEDDWSFCNNDDDDRSGNDEANNRSLSGKQPRVKTATTRRRKVSSGHSNGNVHQSKRQKLSHHGRRRTIPKSWPIRPMVDYSTNVISELPRLTQYERDTVLDTIELEQTLFRHRKSVV